MEYKVCLFATGLREVTSIEDHAIFLLHLGEVLGFDLTMNPVEVVQKLAPKIARVFGEQVVEPVCCPVPVRRSQWYWLSWR